MAENSEKINAHHTHLYFYIIEQFNKRMWPNSHGLPTDFTMGVLNIKSYKTYKKTLDDLIEFGFVFMVEKSKNQFTSNIIALVKNTKAHTKASPKHIPKQVQSKASIIKHINNETIKHLNNLNLIKIFEKEFEKDVLIKIKDALVEKFDNQKINEQDSEFEKRKTNEPWFQIPSQNTWNIKDMKKRLIDSPQHLEKMFKECQSIFEKISQQRFENFIKDFFSKVEAADTEYNAGELRKYFRNDIIKKTTELKNRAQKI